MMHYKICKQCGDPFTPTRDWQEFCDESCRIRYNNRLINRKAEARHKERIEAQKIEQEREQAGRRAMLDRPVDEYERTICHEGVYMLCAAIMESAYKERDREFFGTDMAKLICDSVGVDPQWALMKAWEVTA